MIHFVWPNPWPDKRPTLAHPVLLLKMCLSFQSLDRSEKKQNNVGRKHQETKKKCYQNDVFPCFPVSGRLNQRGATRGVAKPTWLALSTVCFDFFWSGNCQVGERFEFVQTKGIPLVNIMIWHDIAFEMLFALTQTDPSPETAASRMIFNQAIKQFLHSISQL